MARTKNKEHLTEELILGWIEGNLTKSKSELVNSHLKECDKCFIVFSSLFSSYQEIESVKFETTPDILIKKAIDLFGLGKVKPNWMQSFPIVKSVKNLIKQLSEIFKPKVLAYVAISGILVIVVSISFLNIKKDDKSEIDIKNLVAPFMVRQAVPTYSNNLAGIVVSFDNDSIRIEQPTRMKRKLTIHNKKREVILEKEFMDLHNSIPAPEIINQDTMWITIFTLNTVVFKTVIYTQ